RASALPHAAPRSADARSATPSRLRKTHRGPRPVRSPPALAPHRHNASPMSRSDAIQHAAGPPRCPSSHRSGRNLSTPVRRSSPSCAHRSSARDAFRAARRGRPHWPEPRRLPRRPGRRRPHEQASSAWAPCCIGEPPEASAACSSEAPVLNSAAVMALKYIDLDAFKRAHTAREPFSHFPGGGSLKAAQIDVLERDFPNLQHAGYLTLEEVKPQ